MTTTMKAAGITIAADDKGAQMDTDTLKAEAGKRLRLLRATYDLNQEEFAKWMGIGQGRMNFYENGKRLVAPEVVGTIKSKTKATSDWIYFGDEYGMPSGLLEKIRKAQGKAGVDYRPPPIETTTLPLEVQVLVANIVNASADMQRALGQFSGSDAMRELLDHANTRDLDRMRELLNEGQPQDVAEALGVAIRAAERSHMSRS